MKSDKVFAYIDGANLHRGVKSLGWKLDYLRFRSWLRQKFGVSLAYIFIGLISKNANLYTSLQSAEFELVFKDVVYDGDGKAKGNCDADLVLRAMKDFYEHKPAAVVLVSSDGDYASLASFFQEKGVSCTVISPAPVKKCSILLKRTNTPIIYLSDVERKVCVK